MIFSTQYDSYIPENPEKSVSPPYFPRVAEEMDESNER
jgi:hypothetical protein